MSVSGCVSLDQGRDALNFEALNLQERPSVKDSQFCNSSLLFLDTKDKSAARTGNMGLTLVAFC